MHVALALLPLILGALAFGCGWALGRLHRSGNNACHDRPGRRRLPKSSDSHGAGLYPGRRPRAPGKSRDLTGARR